MIEWPKDEKAPTKFSLTTLRRTMSKKEIVRTVKERYRTLPPRAPANLLRSQGDASGAELALLEAWPPPLSLSAWSTPGAERASRTSAAAPRPRRSTRS
jgi:hypothetical protein